MGTIPKTKLNTVIMALLLVFTSTLSMYQSPVSPLIELDEDQTPSNTGNSTGCGYNASLASISNVSISPTSPTAGDDITFYIDLSCVMVGYINGMTWAGSLSSMPNDYSNWYANSSTHSISFTWYNASSGNYSLYGNYNYQPNANSSSTTSLDGINWGFSVGSASSQSEYVDADTNGVTSINSSSTFVGNVTAHNLQSYTSYTIFTMIYDVNTNVSVTANYWNITTGNWNTWSTYPNASNMNAGYYCLAAYVSYYGNASYLDYDLACFSVTGTSGNNSGTTSEWIDTNTNGVTSYTTTSTFVGNVTAYNLMSSTSYTIYTCLLYTSPSPRDLSTSRMPSSA